VFSCYVTSTVLLFLIVCHWKEVVCLFGEVFIRGLVPSSSIYVVLFHVADKQACHVTYDVITVVISISQHCVEQWLVSLQQTRHWPLTTCHIILHCCFVCGLHQWCFVCLSSLSLSLCLYVCLSVRLLTGCSKGIRLFLYRLKQLIRFALFWTLVFVK